MTGCPESERVGKFCEPTWSRVYVTKATVAVAVVVAIVTVVVVVVVVIVVIVVVVLPGPE